MTTGSSNDMKVRYGKINKEMIGRWLRLDATEDGPFWALNLMKYREVADYAGREHEAISGREADDAYAPRDSLAAIGARIVFVADVERITVGDGTAWDRVAIVRYPSRRLFLEMQQRDDFKNKHVHKDAGMEFTIVMSCLPSTQIPENEQRRQFVELTVTGGSGPDEAADAAVFDAAVFNVEGVIVGDARSWQHAAFRWLDAPASPQPASQRHDPARYRLTLRPTIDHLVQSVRA